METGRRYTIAELADASAAALDALGIAAPNGQVRDRPDVRTIRYYNTLGLIDPPLEMTGRTARYGSRHLLQVLAVKAVQARGASLADVQRTLVGASEEELRRAIGPGLPRSLAVTPPTARSPEGSDGQQPAGHLFWRVPPAPPAATPPAPAPPASPAVGRPRGGDAATRPRPLLAVSLGSGATLLIEGAAADAALDSLDAAALHAAAAPLLDYLAAAGLLPGPPNLQGATQ
jgi:DNA-binding transcriptional MerR regulator